MTKAALEASIGTWETWIQLFAILVAIGIVGEVGFGIRLWILNKRLHAFQHAEDLNQEEAIAGLHKEANEALSRAGAFQQKAAELTASNLQLEQAIAPRRLTPKQVSELESLTQFSGRTVDIRSYANDLEGFLLASQIVDALNKAHIGIADNRFTMQAGTDVYLGVLIAGDKTLAGKLEEILAENGLNKSGVIHRNLGGVSMSMAFGVTTVPQTAATLTVALKPIK